MLLNESERSSLLRFARQTIAAHLTRSALPELATTGNLDRRCGAFVTVQAEQKLRGCIGYIETDRQLIDVVGRCAISAATDDPRFPPMTPEELDRVSLEISVLGPIEPVADVATIVIGRHGLVVQQDHRRGLLLPQVATEWVWNRETFLSQTCVKAGLPATAWQHGAEIFSFEAEVFGEQRIRQ
ncbi:MAG: AmmeMemoRadiSam system protein A [Vicinamibacterales bacterium]